MLLARFLSFRNRRTYESMAQTYRSLSGQGWTQPVAFGDDWRKFLFYMALLVISSANLITPWAWGDATFRASIALDLLFWLLALRWVVRAHWLKALGRKERLKEGLDDARSRLKARAASEPGASEPGYAPAAFWPFRTLFLLMGAATLTLSGWRWMTADRVYHHAALKGCLLDCLDLALERFHREGRLEGAIQEQPCVSRYRERIEMGIGFQRGELLLWSIEKPGHDFFGNGKPGDQGMLLDAEGRFRATGRRIR